MKQGRNVTTQPLYTMICAAYALFQTILFPNCAESLHAVTKLNSASAITQTYGSPIPSQEGLSIRYIHTPDGAVMKPLAACWPVGGTWKWPDGQGACLLLVAEGIGTGYGALNSHAVPCRECMHNSLIVQPRCGARQRPKPLTITDTCAHLGC